MRHIEFPMFDPCLLWGSWIMDFGWASIFYLNCYVQYFCPKLQVEFLHKNHAFNTLHNYFIGFFHDVILLWWIWSTCLLVDSTFIQEGINFFGNKSYNFMPVLFSTNTSYILNTSNTYPLAFKGYKMCVFYQCDKISCSTMDYLKPTYLGLSMPSYLPI
jgi:hypothetical protein